MVAAYLRISAATAAAVARTNAETLGVGGRARFVERSFGDDQGEWFDLALSNPPYISRTDVETLAPDVRNHDPAMALSPGDDALVAYRQILAGLNAWLRPDGWLGVEVGIGQASDLAQLMAAAGLVDVAVFDDLAGIPRAVFGRRPA